MNRDFLIGWALFIALCPFYVCTMSPSVSVGDSGEFIAAAATLSLPHAPSYPLFSLLGKCAIALNPFAHIAYRVNLISVFFAVGTSVLLFLLSRLMGLSKLAALVAAATIFFSNILWEHSVAAEVFSLNSFFAVLILCGFAQGGSLLCRVCLSSFLFGLGMGNHHTLVFVVPTIAFLYFREQWRDRFSLNNVIWLALRILPISLLFFVIGFSVYLYLPIRSFKNPLIDWSNPETVQNFVRVIRRADYGSFALTLGEKLPRNFESAARQGGRYLSSLFQDLSWVGICIGFIGWIFWFRKDRFEFCAFFLLFSLSGIGFLILGNLPFDAQSEGILPRFYLMPAIPFLLALAHFFDWMVQTVSSARLKPVTWIAGILLPAFLLFRAHGHRTFSRTDFAAYDYGRNLLSTLPPGAILFMDGGDDAFYTLAYLTMAEKRRPDLQIHDRGGLIYRNPYGDDFRKITKEEKENRRQQIEGSYLGLRPLYYSTFNKEVLKGAKLIPRGILYEASPPQAASPALWQSYFYRGVYESNLNQPYRLRSLVPVYPFLQGIESWDMKYLKRAAGFGTDIIWLQPNLCWEISWRAYDLTRQNKISEAESLYKFVLEVDPKFVSAYSNLGVLAEKRNDVETAEDYYQKAIEIDPKYVEAYYNLGVVYWRRNQWAEVIRMFEKTLELNPNHPSAPRYLFLAKQKVK